MAFSGAGLTLPLVLELARRPGLESPPADAGRLGLVRSHCPTLVSYSHLTSLLAASLKCRDRRKPRLWCSPLYACKLVDAMGWVLSASTQLSAMTPSGAISRPARC